MATITVSSNANLATLGYSAGDDIVITGSATLTCDSDPSALPAIRSIRPTAALAKFVVRNSATAFSAGNMWKLPFENAGSVIGTNGTLAFTNGATCQVEGEMMVCYTATGVANETVLDASNVLGVDIDWPYCIEAETAVGSGVYRMVPVINVGTPADGYIAVSAKNRFGTGDVGRVLFYDIATRLLQAGDGTNGTLFPSGLKFRIPNILIWMPPFTLTVGAAGWTTATGSQPVVSSTNAPVNSNLSYVIGSEVVAITTLPTGTTVNVATRAQDGTTAATYASGAVAYSIPNISIAQAGKLLTQTGGVYILKKCFFSRWWAINPNAFSNFNADRVGIVAPVFGIVAQSSAGPFTLNNSVLAASPCVPRQNNFSGTSITGDTNVSNTLMLGVVSTVGTTGYGNNQAFTANGLRAIRNMQNLRIWRAGCPSGVSFTHAGLINFQSGNSCDDNALDGLEVVNLGTQFQDIVVNGVSGFRYSSTNGPANTSTSDQAVVIAGAGGIGNFIFHDFDIINGGFAPYDAWLDCRIYATNVILHNKVGGVVRDINCQGRTQRPIVVLNGFNTIAANMTFSNMRTGGTAINSTFGNGVVLRNVRWSDLAGAVVDNTSILPTRGMVLDFPGGPLNALNGTSTGAVSNQPDVQAVYACPNTWPGLLGGIYVGPITAKQNKDLYDLTGGAYQTNTGVLFIETTGDTATIKSTAPVTGVASIPGTSPVYFGVNPSTGLTYEFRMCVWGDDITAVSWASFTGGNVQSAFNALTGYTIYKGLNFQLRLTATTTSAGRCFQQCFVPAQMDASYNPPTGTVSVNAVGAASGALMALYVGSDLWATTTIDGSGEGSVGAPYDFDDVAVAGTLKIRVVDHESIDLPVTWVGDGANVPAPMAALTGYTAGPYPNASFDKVTKTVTVSASMTTAQLWSAWREYIVQLANFDVDDDWTYPELNAGTWAVAFSGAGAVTGSYTDRDGTRAPILAPNLPTGTRVQFYDVTGAAELLNTSLASPGASTSLYFTTTKTIRLRASKLGSLPIEAFGVITASGLTFIDEFVDDDVYIAKGIDGSTVTEFSADEPNVQIDSNDPDGTSSVWRCYAWFRYYETSSIGVAGVLFGAATAVDTENLAIDSARADIQLDNVSGVPLKISDGYMYRTDGATIIAPTSGSIQMDPKKAYAAPAADFLEVEIEPGFTVGRLLRITAAGAAGAVTGGPGGFVARNLSNTADMIAGTADPSGNRSSVTYGA